MSRCFPFPPSGHIVRNGARSEALIESIKLPTEMDKARKDIKKEKKREKEEKRKEKKERKRKEGAPSSADSKKFNLIDDKKGIRPDGKLQKVEHYENEQLERSGITEEHGQPTFSQELCCLSDSSQSSKRKRSSSLSNDEHGTAIRIRIPLKKHRKTEESKIEHQVGPSCGTSGIADSFTQAPGGRDHQLPCVTREESNKVVGISESRHGKVLQPLVNGDNMGTNNVVDDKRRRMASLYDSLFLIQIPPLTGDVFESDDQEWLFGSERTEARPSFSIKAKKSATATDAFHCSSQQCLWPPRAQYLAEAEIYALPYTVPF